MRYSHKSVPGCYTAITLAVASIPELVFGTKIGPDPTRPTKKSDPIHPIQPTLRFDPTPVCLLTEDNYNQFAVAYQN